LFRYPETNTLVIKLNAPESYTTAQNLALFPWNLDSVVEHLCSQQGYDPAQTFEIGGENPPIPSPTTIFDALKYYCDITSLIRKMTFKQFAKYA